MPYILLTTTQSSTLPAPQPSQRDGSIPLETVILMVPVAIVLSITLLAGYQRYKRYRVHQQIQTLEHLWQQSPPKRLL